ncbi:uncharacterized protein J3R85_002006 [Psidium guajava]|nr:uncharacterized protein J3R85_002006 [Psidium guajava]
MSLSRKLSSGTCKAYCGPLLLESRLLMLWRNKPQIVMAA